MTHTITADALLFDLDGTLVDTSAAVQASWREIAAGLRVPFEAFAPHMHGIPLSVCSHSPLRRSRPTNAVGSRHRHSLTRPTRLFQWPRFSARELIGAPPADRWAIVTSGDLTLAHASITKARLPFPQVLIAADDVQHGRPAADPYLSTRSASHLNGASSSRILSQVSRPVGRPAQRCSRSPRHTVARLTAATRVIRDLGDVHTTLRGGRIDLTATERARP
jgi:sugar-phosphatase